MAQISLMSNNIRAKEVPAPDDPQWRQEQHQQPSAVAIDGNSLKYRLLPGIPAILHSHILTAVFLYNAPYAPMPVLLSLQRAELVADQYSTGSGGGGNDSTVPKHRLPGQDQHRVECGRVCPPGERPGRVYRQLVREAGMRWRSCRSYGSATSFFWDGCTSCRRGGRPLDLVLFLAIAWWRRLRRRSRALSRRCRRCHGPHQMIPAASAEDGNDAAKSGRGRFMGELPREMTAWALWHITISRLGREQQGLRHVRGGGIMHRADAG